MEKKIIYRAPYFEGKLQIILTVPFFIAVLYVGYLSRGWEYFAILFGIVLITLHFSSFVTIYDEEIKIRKLFIPNRYILINECISFYDNNGPGNLNRFGIDYKLGRNVKTLSFNISKSKDIKMLKEFFESKKLKVSVKVPRL